MSSSTPRPCRRTTIKKGLPVWPQTAGSASSSGDNNPPDCAGLAVELPLNAPLFVDLIKYLQLCMRPVPLPAAEKCDQIQGIFSVLKSSDRFLSPCSSRKRHSSFRPISLQI